MDFTAPLENTGKRTARSASGRLICRDGTASTPAESKVAGNSNPFRWLVPEPACARALASEVSPTRLPPNSIQASINDRYSGSRARFHLRARAGRRSVDDEHQA